MGFAEYVLAHLLGCVHGLGFCTTDLGGRAEMRLVSAEPAADQNAFNKTAGVGTSAARANGEHGIQAWGGRGEALLATG